MSDVHNLTDAQLNDLLHFDPLDTAEKITGSRDDDLYMPLGLELAHAHGRVKEEVLTARGDTIFSNQLEDYLRIITANGFEEVLKLPFKSVPYRDEEPRDETFYVYAHRDGFLLSFDTYDSERVNAARLSYNVHVANGTTNNHMSSGGYSDRNNPDRKYPVPDSHVPDYVWVGYHDAREALIFNISLIRSVGTLLSKWYQAPFLWFLHHGDTKGEYDYNVINAERIAMLPQWVQDMIAGEIES